MFEHQIWKCRKNSMNLPCSMSSPRERQTDAPLEIESGPVSGQAVPKPWRLWRAILPKNAFASLHERDDDGDDLIDYPQDPGCDSAQDRNGRNKGPLNGNSLRNAGIATLAMVLVLLVVGIRLQRDRHRKP